MLQTLECCALSNFAILIAGVNNLAMQKCAFLDRAQFNNTTCIFLLYEILVVCTYVIHDVEEQCVTHLLSTTKKQIVVDRMFYKIIFHNSTMVDFALASYIRVTT
jgi:hypothetical protein